MDVDSSQRQRPNWLAPALIFVFVLAMYGRPAPWGNEQFYLIRPESASPQSPLHQDWTLSQPASEHYVFNSIAKPIAALLPVEVLGWGGRILCWVLSIMALFRLATLFRLSPWSTATVILIWLGLGQSLVGGEWMIQGLEAKCLAYVCLLFCLDALARGRLIRGSVLLGVAFSLHPGVGLWAFVASFSALLLTDRAREIAKGVAVAGLLALPAVLPVARQLLLRPDHGGTDWEFMTLVWMPGHLDPLSWNRRAILAAFLMLAFNLYQSWRHRDQRELVFLAGLQIGLAVVFVGGVILRLGDLFDLLRFMPFRLFPLFVPLLFFMSLFRAFDRAKTSDSKVMWVIALLSIASIYNPLGGIYDNVTWTLREWRQEPAEAPVLDWIAGNTPDSAVFIAPPWLRSFWHRANRPLVVNYYYPPYSNWEGWSQRVESLGADLTIRPGGPVAARRRLEEGYHSLPLEGLVEAARRYNAEFLLSRTAYDLPLLHSVGDFRIYRLFPNQLQ